MANAVNLLVGCEVEYSVTRQEADRGIVMAVEDMQVKFDSPQIITGYAIRDRFNKIKHVAYWRITAVLQDNKTIPIQLDPPQQQSNANRGLRPHQHTDAISQYQKDKQDDTHPLDTTEPIDDLPF